MPLAGDDVELHVHGPALSDDERAHRAELEQLVGELGLDGRVTIGDPVPRAEIPALFATHDALVNNMRAGAPDKVVYEAAAAVPPGARLEPDLRRAPRARAALHALGPGRARRADPDARRDEPGGGGGTGGDARERVASEPLGAVVGAWHPRRGGDLVTDGVVLHTQKVAGISGSEAHLLQLLPDLRERGWDVRFLMLHEDEPGAWEFADALRARGVPLDDIRLRADVDPIAFGEVAAYLGRLRPRILHTHLVHADVYGQLAGSLTRVPLRLSTKHGFNEFREGRWFGFADRSVGSLAHVHIAISQGLAQYLAETEGFEGGGLRDRPLRDRRGRAAVPYAGSEPRLLCVGRLIPIKGHLVLLRALAQARARVPKRHARRRRPRPARAGAEGVRARARARRRRALPRLRLAGADGDRGRGDRGRALARRGVRHGRARGDGARAAGHRERGGRAPGDRRRRRDRAGGAAGGRGRARGGDRRARRRSPRAAEMGAAARARALEEFTPSAA